VTTDLEIVPATTARFDDLATVLGGHAENGCWCLYYRLTSGEFDLVPDRPGKVRELLAADTAPGLLAYRDGTAVGWCGLGPRSQMGRLVRSRTILPVDELPVWSVTCFVVRPGFRRQGVARALLAAAVSYAAGHSAPALEGYPIDPAGTRVSTSFAYVGTTSMFEAAGFRRVTQTAARSARLPRWLMRHDLSSLTSPVIRLVLRRQKEFFIASYEDTVSVTTVRLRRQPQGMA
jgi:GNAT superfamily N-acetyltransferase